MALPLLLSYMLSLSIPLTNAKKNLTFLALSTADISGAQWIAIQEINNNSDLLRNFTLHYKPFDTQENVQHTLRQSLTIIQHENTEDNIYFPIILGPDWSSLAVTSAPFLNGFSMGVISSAATSITLSDTNEYPFFYR